MVGTIKWHKTHNEQCHRRNKCFRDLATTQHNVAGQFNFSILKISSPTLSKPWLQTKLHHRLNKGMMPNKTNKQKKYTRFDSRPKSAGNFTPRTGAQRKSMTTLLHCCTPTANLRCRKQHGNINSLQLCRRIWQLAVLYRPHSRSTGPTACLPLDMFKPHNLEGFRAVLMKHVYLRLIKCWNTPPAVQKGILTWWQVVTEMIIQPKKKPYTLCVCSDQYVAVARVRKASSGIKVLPKSWMLLLLALLLPQWGLLPQGHLLLRGPFSPVFPHARSSSMMHQRTLAVGGKATASNEVIRRKSKWEWDDSLDHNCGCAAF